MRALSPPGYARKGVLRADGGPLDGADILPGDPRGFQRKHFLQAHYSTVGQERGSGEGKRVLVLEERRGAAFEAERVYTYVGYLTRFDRARTTLSLFVID